MLKLFITPRLEKVPYFILFRSLGGPEENRLFQDVIIRDVDCMFTVVNDITQCDFVTIPYNYFSILKHSDYIKDCIQTAQSTGKKILVFAYGDSDEAVNIPNSIIVRTSQYRYKKASNEVIMPAYVEDLGKNGITYREKKNTKAVVSFVGWAGFAHISDKVKYFFRVIFQELKSIIDKKATLHKPGLYFRRHALSRLANSSGLNTSFTVRKSYSGHKKTIELSPVQARTEFVDRVSNSDFALAVKGDGNYSLRFFEILSLGRIPLLIDTDCPLPFEDRISYQDFIVRIDYKDLKRVDELLAIFYKKIGSEQFMIMQKKARAVFEQFLSVESYFKILCVDLKKISYEK